MEFRLEAVANEHDAPLVWPQGGIPTSDSSVVFQKGSAMKRMSFWSSHWQCWTRTSRRSGTRRHTPSRLETLEARLNLAAVLVVETADAYWLIEEPSNDSLAPASEGDCLYNDDFGGGSWNDDTAWDDGLAHELPTSVTPITSNGQTLDATRASLASSLLAELWTSEPDFFYEDVLSVKFYDGTTMDTLMNSGLFDDGGGSDSFNTPSSQTSDFLVDSNSGNNTGSSANNNPESFSNRFGSTSGTTIGAAKPNSTVTEPVNTDDSKEIDIFAAAKAEVASWRKRVEAESIVMNNAGQATAFEALVVATTPSQKIAASQMMVETLAPSSREDFVSDAAALAAIESAATSPTTIVAREMTKAESFFAKFPMFGVVSGSTSMLRFIPGNSDANRMNPVEAAESDSAADSDNDSLSYSQWASLFGTVSLLGTSLCRNGNHDLRETPPSFRSKNDRKRPVVC